MPARKLVTPTRLLHVALPEPVLARLDLHLWSEVEARVPKGAYQSFLVELINEFFTSRRLSLEIYGLPPGYSIMGRPEILAALHTKLLKLP